MTNRGTRYHNSGRFHKDTSPVDTAVASSSVLHRMSAIFLVMLATISFAGCGGSSGTSDSTNLPASVTISASSYDFGDIVRGNSITQIVAIVRNIGLNTLHLNPTISGDPSYTIVSDQSCGATLTAGASCGMVITYNPMTASAPQVQQAVVHMGFTNITASALQNIDLTGISVALSPGVVTATGNPQVALYTMTMPFPGSMRVKFGTSTSYNFTTSSVSTDTGGQQVSVFVAGMQATTTYHMTAEIEFDNGITVTDTDHTFTTQAIPSRITLNSSVSTPSGLTPQSGVEMLNALPFLAVTDLSGNVIWTYLGFPAGILDYIQGVKMLPNGDFLMDISPASSTVINTPASTSSIEEIREIDLAGDTIRDISISQLNAELAVTSCTECNVTLQYFSHDVTPLPNGHWLVLANTIEYLSSTTTPALTNEPAQNVLGDVVVDLDQNLQPVWVWNTFNHLDPNRHPMNFPDWTHANAITYSPDDGNILVSLRHQNWVVKVDYRNGLGTGGILWHLGEGGDFALVGGTDPTDWQYAQHAPSFTSPNTTGVFSLTLMDNGNDRIFPSGVTCGAAGAPACQYSTVPVFKIDESAKTATLTFHSIAPASEYNGWGGNAQQLVNGDIEYDLCGVGANSIVNEVTQDSSAQVVWSMTSTGINFYRAFRMPSLYPGVQW